jgi:DNA-dependent RNA polymerase auxiliary subunit epsilon
MEILSNDDYHIRYIMKLEKKTLHYDGPYYRTSAFNSVKTQFGLVNILMI